MVATDSTVTEFGFLFLYWSITRHHTHNAGKHTGTHISLCTCAYLFRIGVQMCVSSYLLTCINLWVHACRTHTCLSVCVASSFIFLILSMCIILFAHLFITFCVNTDLHSPCWKYNTYIISIFVLVQQMGRTTYMK